MYVSFCPVVRFWNWNHKQSCLSLFAPQVGGISDYLLSCVGSWNDCYVNNVTSNQKAANMVLVRDRSQEEQEAVARQSGLARARRFTYTHRHGAPRKNLDERSTYKDGGGGWHYMCLREQHFMSRFSNQQQAVSPEWQR